MRMDQVWCGLAGAAVALTGIGGLAMRAQPASDDDAAMHMPSPEEMAEMMQAWQDAMTPGPQHQMLDPLVGEWETSSKMWWGGPGAPPTESTGTASVKWIMGGRYLQEDIESTIPMPDFETGEITQMPMKGMGITGFDNYRKMFISSWIDNFGTGLLTMKGSATPDGKTITFYGEMDEPMLGVTGRMVRYVVTFIDDDHRRFEMYDLHAGDDYKVMEVDYRRQ